ncbi:hypothetical protein RN001_001628 [Aquatica leii]|uniref:Uncharacterized protein n=1 Tax=Aquatica leii TaxID=1421715 RepID=A0AAN7PG74_9COLE|nr:hypothetical protein RN001_001628 [Aquatica leii]
MYKLVLYFLFVALVQANIDNHEVTNTILTTIEKCITKNNLPHEEIWSVWKQPEFPEDNQEFTKFCDCIFTELNIIKDDAVDYDNVKFMLPNFAAIRFNLSKDKSKEITEKLNTKVCFNLPKTTEAVIHCIRVRNCLYKEFQKVMS